MRGHDQETLDWWGVALAVASIVLLSAAYMVALLLMPDTSVAQNGGTTGATTGRTTGATAEPTTGTISGDGDTIIVEKTVIVTTIPNRPLPKTGGSPVFLVGWVAVLALYAVLFAWRIRREIR